MAVAYLLTPDQHRQRDRDSALADVIRLTVSEMGLPADVEPDYWQAVRVRLETLLELADAAVAARLEYEALDRRIDRHVQGHYLCPCNRTCEVYSRLNARLRHLQRRADRAVQILLGGRL